jgi:F-type H+-transporting ATPase subunit gamma
MTTPEAIKRQINTSEDLQSVVKTMKALAAVSLRQYEKAVESLADYTRTIEMGLQAVLKDKSATFLTEKSKIETVGIIIFGSDQGMCGQFNDQIIQYTLNTLKQFSFTAKNQKLITVGSRLTSSLTAEKIPINHQFFIPSSVIGITSLVQEILVKIDQWQQNKPIHSLFLFYNQPQKSSIYQPVFKQLLPLNKDWLAQLQSSSWKTKMIPSFSLSSEALFSALIRQYFFITLYQGCAESLASENSSRLASMQIAQKNIEERLEELNREYQQIRQTDITNELLDIVSGFEALKKEKSDF